MIYQYELVLNDGTTHLFDTQKYHVQRRTHGVEVLYRNEMTKDYSVNIYPWHTVARLGAYGKLERR